jgi:hypothetical protein
MRFFVPERYACLGNALNNPYLAVGTITEDTPLAFAQFARKNSHGASIELTSPGGSLLAALKLGEKIRVLGYDTSLGEVCASACTYAILGGVNRYVAQTTPNAEADYDNRTPGASGTKLGVHQFYQSAALSEPLKKAFSAIDKSSDQILMGILLEYTLRMGVDVRLVSAASSVPPWEEMRWLTQEEMISWRIDNTHRVYTNLVFHAFGRSGSYVEVGSTKGSDESYLRMFCKKNLNEPLFAFITDQTVPLDQTAGAAIRINSATDHVRNLLSRMNIVLSAGPDKSTGAFQVQEVQGVARSDDKVRVYAVVRPGGFSHVNTDKLTRVALEDGGDLARSEWTFQDFVKFNLQGDRKLIGLAMRNCTD